MSISPSAPRWIRRQNRVAAHSCPVLPLHLCVKLTARDRQRGPSCGESKYARTTTLLALDIDRP